MGLPIGGLALCRAVLDQTAVAAFLGRNQELADDAAGFCIN